VILTFFLLSMLVLLADGWTNGWSTMNLFCVSRSSWRDPLGYIRLFGHVLGHANWEHFLNNMLLLLVVGPPMEEKYGSIPLLKGILNAIKKRPVRVEQIAALIDHLENTYANEMRSVVTSAEIGNAVMEQLKTIDAVAYVRFASVYQDFSDVAGFIAAISELEP